jgi:hypothetical protein
MLTYLPLPSIVTKGGLVVVPSEVTRIVLITWRALSILVEILNAKSDQLTRAVAVSNPRDDLKKVFIGIARC